MRRILFWLCVVALMLAPLGAWAAEGDAVIAREDNVYVERCLYVNDCLVLTGDRVYTYQIGDADMEAYDWLYNLDDFVGENESATYEGTLFEDDGALKCFSFVTRYDNNHAEFRRALLSDVELKDGVVLRLNTREVEWPDELIERYDEESYPVSPQEPFVLNGRMFFASYDQDTYEEILYCMDLETMQPDRIETEGSVQMFTPYSNGCALLVLRDYSAGAVKLLVYDPETKSSQVLTEISVGDHNYPSGYAADSETGDVYAVLDGEIRKVDLATGELGDGLADMPLNTYSNRAGVFFGGKYYAYCAEGVVIRNLYPEQRAEKKLKIYDSNWTDAVTDASIAFGNAHGDVSISVTRDSIHQRSLVEHMLNRSNDVDIYVLDMTYSAFEALRTRGFMVELDGSEKLTALAEDWYPAVREALSRDGRLVALPVDVRSYGLGVNEKALEKIGLTIEDLPTNWSDFLDFLANDLPQYMKNDPSVTLCYDGMLAEDAKWQLFSSIFLDYQAYANQTMDVPSYDTELMRTLLEKLDCVDFVALGLDETYEENDGVVAFFVDYSADAMLFDLNGTERCFANDYSIETPMVLSMTADTPAIMDLNVTAAFVNPYSENVDLAIKYLEMLSDCLSESLWYNFNPNLNEPLRNDNWEDSLKAAQEFYDDIRKKYDAAEEADKQALEEELAGAEDWLEEVEADSWAISQEQIDWYRSYGENISVDASNWLYQDDSGEAQELIMQYVQEQIGASEMLQGIDKKVRMMQMEGY